MFLDVGAKQDVAGEKVKMRGRARGPGGGQDSGADPAEGTCTKDGHTTVLSATSLDCEAASPAPVSSTALIFSTTPFWATKLIVFLETKTAFGLAFCMETYTRECYLEHAFRTEKKVPLTHKVDNERRVHQSPPA